MTPPRIIIVTYNWPPRNAIGTHRPVSWARHWSKKGAQVTVLTAKKYAFDEPSVYGANENMPFVETEKADTPLSIYAATKKATEAMAHSCAHLFSIPTTMLRALANAYEAG